MKTPPPSENRWLLLIQQIPRSLQYLRVKTWRRLKQLGAVPIKNAVYALPRTEDRNEDLQWVIREIVEGGGEATVVDAGFIQGMNDAEVEALFRAARDEDYDELSKDARALEKRLSKRTAKLSDDARLKLDAELKKLRDRFDEIARVDFFVAPGQGPARALLANVEALLHPPPPVTGGEKKTSPADYRGRTWVTRKGVFVDRIASAWLIRRFIDPKAKLKYVAAKGYVPERGELRFDMFEAEFTHEGDRCTFEVLCRRLGLDDAALAPIAEIVHDIDIKDGKFGRAEAAGIERLLAGLALRAENDDERIARGSAVFDDLYEVFRRKKSRE
jgi:hypothetical protein